jgi:hypothetical protein
MKSARHSGVRSHIHMGWALMTHDVTRSYAMLPSSLLLSFCPTTAQSFSRVSFLALVRRTAKGDGDQPSEQLRTGI